MVIYHPMETHPPKKTPAKNKIQEHVEWTKITPLKIMTDSLNNAAPFLGDEFVFGCVPGVPL